MITQRCSLLGVTALTAAIIGSCTGDQDEVVWPTRPELVSIVQQAAGVSEPVSRAEVLRLALSVRDPALDGLIQRGLADGDLTVRASVLDGLLHRGDNSVETSLASLLASGQPSEHQLGLWLTLELAPRDMRDRLLDNLAAMADTEQRLVLLEGVLAHIEPTPALLTRLLEGASAQSNPVLVADAIHLSSEATSARLLEPVTQRLLSEVEEDRRFALEVLARIPVLDTWLSVRWLRQNGSPEEQERALLALARLGQSDTSGSVLAMLQRAGDELTPLVLRALAGLGGDEARHEWQSSAYDTRVDVRRAALLALLDVGPTPAELLPFLRDAEPTIALRAGRELSVRPVHEIARVLCADLRTGEQPAADLQWLWSLAETPRHSLATVCLPQIEALMGSPDAALRGLAAHLYFDAVAPTAEQFNTSLATQHEVLYAYLEASLQQEPREFRDIYRRLLDHELLLVRVLAALGLLQSTP